MRRAIGMGAAAVGGLVIVATGAIILGGQRWSRATAAAVRRLDHHGPPLAGTTIYDPEGLAGLPEPVTRYFDFALTPGQPLLHRARITQRGEFRARPSGPWSPFTAVEHFAVRPPGFVWDAAIRMAPLLAVRVRDSYLDGVGTMDARLAGVVRVADQRGTPEMASSSLARYLAEAVWVPTALLPSSGVTWTAIDDSTARATLSDRGVTVSAAFHFGPRGEIVGNSGERFRDVNGTGVLTPWAGRFREYERVQGMMVPRVGEVEWILLEQPLPYWRGRLVDFDYEFGNELQGNR